MGEAKRRRQLQDEIGDVKKPIELFVLPPDSSVNGARIRELTGDNSIPEDTKVILTVFRVVRGDSSFSAGFCLGNASGFSAVGVAVIDRLRLESPTAKLHVVLVEHEDIAWDIVLRHLKSFKGQLLLFAFPNSDVYDAGVAPIWSSEEVKQFDPDGQEFRKLTAVERRAILTEKAALLDRPPPPRFYEAGHTLSEDAPWIFRFVTPAGKAILSAVWNGRRDFAHLPPPDVASWVGGDRIAIVQVASPVGLDQRSSLRLTHKLAASFDGIIHWARDSETFQSILRSFIRLDFESVSPPETPENWNPEVVIFGAND